MWYEGSLYDTSYQGNIQITAILYLKGRQTLCNSQSAIFGSKIIKIHTMKFKIRLLWSEVLQFNRLWGTYQPYTTTVIYRLYHAM